MLFVAVVSVPVLEEPMFAVKFATTVFVNVPEPDRATDLLMVTLSWVIPSVPEPDSVPATRKSGTTDLLSVPEPESPTLLLNPTVTALDNVPEPDSETDLLTAGVCVDVSVAEDENNPSDARGFVIVWGTVLVDRVTVSIDHAPWLPGSCVPR